MSELLKTPVLQMILERIHPGRSRDCFKLFACRGAGRGCPRNRFRRRKNHCDDCVEADPSETLEQLYTRMTRGNA